VKNLFLHLMMIGFFFLGNIKEVGSEVRKNSAAWLIIFSESSSINQNDIKGIDEIQKFSSTQCDMAPGSVVITIEAGYWKNTTDDLIKSADLRSAAVRNILISKGLPSSTTYAAATSWESINSRMKKWDMSPTINGVLVQVACDPK